MEDLKMYQQSQNNLLNKNDQYNQSNQYPNNQYYQNNQYNQNGAGFSLNHSDLRSLAGWAKFVAVVQIICASLMCFSIITVFINPIFIICPVMAVILIIMGVKLLNAASSIRRFVDTGDYYSLSSSLQGFKSYFKINGILIIVAISLIVLMVILSIFAIGLFCSLLNEYRLRY